MRWRRWVGLSGVTRLRGRTRASLECEGYGPPHLYLLFLYPHASPGPDAPGSWAACPLPHGKVTQPQRPQGLPRSAPGLPLLPPCLRPPHDPAPAQTLHSPGCGGLRAPHHAAGRGARLPPQRHWWRQRVAFEPFRVLHGPSPPWQRPMDGELRMAQWLLGTPGAKACP